jgi:uncharacterized protein involved in outer membrane biogenesis
LIATGSARAVVRVMAMSLGLGLGLGTSGPGRAETTADTLLSAAPLVPAWLRSLHIEAAVTAEEVVWQRTTLRDLRAQLGMVDARFEIHAESSQVAGGTVQLDLTHESEGAGRLRIRGAALALGAMGPFEAYVTGTPMTLDVALTGSGDSARTLAQSAQGSIDFQSTGPGTIEKTVERVSGSLLSSIFRAFTPLRSANETTAIECLKVHLPVAQGRAEGPLLAELWTQRMRIMGGGRIDFGRETLDLVFRPHGRRGLQIRGLRAVHAVAVDGTFGEPRVDIDSGRLLSRAAALGTAVVTVGGTTVIDTFNAQRESRRQPCGAVAASAIQK